MQDVPLNEFNPAGLQLNGQDAALAKKYNTPSVTINTGWLREKNDPSKIYKYDPRLAKRGDHLEPYTPTQEELQQLGGAVQARPSLLQTPVGQAADNLTQLTHPMPSAPAPVQPAPVPPPMVPVQ